MVRVLVDTSVSVDFFDGHDSAEANALARYFEVGSPIRDRGGRYLRLDF